MSFTRSLRLALFGLALSSSACTKILGDFEVDDQRSFPQGDGGVQGDIVVEPLTGLITTEQGAKATFTIVLARKPKDNVAIALSSSNPAEGTVSPFSVTFTPDNYDAPQTVTVTGVDDDLMDGNQTYTIVTSPASSSDSSYAGTDSADVTVVNVDDETAGFTVLPTSGLLTTESGGEDTFTIVLNSEPKADVTIALSSSNTAEGTVYPETVKFSVTNWNAPQTVTVTGVDDDAADGLQPYTIVTAPAESDDDRYNRLDPDDVQVQNQDNDSAGITLSPEDGLLTGENGQMAMFGIVLNSPPTADVVIGLSSSDPGEGTVSPTSVTFTPLNWMAPQIVTVTGVDDEIADGNQPYTIVTAPADSDDPSYTGLDGPDAKLLNVDNDSPGISVSPSGELETSESGSSADFTVVLNSRPSGDVLLDLSSSAPDEGTVTPTLIAFTPTNWNAPQVVTVMGVDDPMADGRQKYAIHITPNPATADPGYLALTQVDVPVANVDDDSPGIIVTGQGGLTTNEQGMTALFTIALTSQPRADVTIALSTSNPAEGTVSPTSLRFTPSNYAAPQVVTVRGVDDAIADGNQVYRVLTAPAVSTDPDYSGLNGSDVTVTNIDDDSPGITVSPTSGLTTSEGGGSAFFTVVLNSQPTAAVSIALSSTNPAEGVVSPSTLTFTPANWNAPQTVTVTGQDDPSADGAQPYRIVTAPAVSNDPLYHGLDPFDVTLTNVDNDSAGITVTAAPNLTTTEAGGFATFSVVLNSKPSADVIIPLASSKPNEGTVSPASLLFTPLNWNAPQIVTVTGVDDAVADGNQQYTILTQLSQSADPQYDGRNPPDVTLTNIDNDSAGITVTPVSGLSTSEAGTSATFSIVLNSKPLANVSVPLRSSKPKEGTVSPTSVTFTPDNWNAPRTITVTGVDDDVADGAQLYSIITDPAVSTDPKYADLDALDVNLTNVDDDSAGITVTVIDDTTSEGGETGRFSIVLNSEPTANVTIPLSSSDTTEGTISVSSVVFTPMNWAAPQTVTVTGVNDSVADGAQPYSIITGPAVSDDDGYDGMNPPDVALTNVDDDSAGITVTVIDATSSEGGGTASFSIVLNSEPTASVTIPLSSSDTTEGKLEVTEVTFTSANWSAPKLITVTGIDDDVADGDQPYKIVLGAAVSDDDDYDGLNPPDVALTNVDDDSAGITVTVIDATSGEDGSTASFSIVLNSEPTASVTIPLSSSDTTEGTLSQSSVVFTPMNWAAPQTVVVTGVNDDVADGNQPYLIVTGPAVSNDTNYAGLNPPDVSLSNVDNDSAGISVTPAAGPTTESGTTTTFKIVLNSEPTASVTIPLSSSDPTEGTLAVSSVTFTTANWSSAQTVTVTGVNDNVADGDQHYWIILGPAESEDPNYDGMDADDVEIVNVDDDSAGITVSEPSNPTSESGDTAIFSVVLNSQPTASVTIALTSSDPGEGTVTPSSLTFTTQNWGAPQQVTVQGVDDDVADGDQVYTIVTAKATSDDPTYAAINPPDVELVNIDDDSAGFKISEAVGPTSEAGTTTTFTIALNSQPTATVTIPLSSSDGSEGEVLPTSLTFDATDWDAPKVVTVRGKDDAVADGPQTFKVLTEAVVSKDGGYGGKNPPDVEITNLDDDSAFIVVTQPDSPVTGESATAPTVTFGVVLTSRPTAPVTIPLTSSKPSEGVIVDPSPAELVFTEDDWNMARIVTVQGVQDDVADGDQPYVVRLEPAISDDAGYSGFDAEDVPLGNADDDDAGGTT